MTRPVPSGRISPVSTFLLYVASVVTVAMALFPPFTSLRGTEYAFVLTGPEWSRGLDGAVVALGLAPRVDWPALAVQLGAVWAIALGGSWFFTGGARTGPPGERVW